MPLSPGCPRCPLPVSSGNDGYTCEQHGRIEPLWRPEVADYESFAELVKRSEDQPTYLPWPMSPGWSIADFGLVGSGAGAAATFTTTVGTSDLDGDVEVSVVSEDPGVGLGARCAGTTYAEPGLQVGHGPSAIRIRAGAKLVPMWLVDPEPTTGGDDDIEVLSRSVFVGEAGGRWLWVVLRPASAALLLREEWLLADVTGFGPHALEMPFGGPRPTW